VDVTPKVIFSPADTVNMTTSISSLNAYRYSNVFAVNSGGAGGKLYVPMPPSMAMRAQFNHVTGVPSPTAQGVSVSKVKILDTLIDQLITLKNRPEEAQELQSLDTGNIDTLITQYQDKLSLALSQAKSNPFILPGVLPQGGALFSLTI
jgi:hypothetical protein